MNVATFRGEFVETTAKFLVCADAAGDGYVFDTGCVNDFFKGIDELRNGAFLETRGDVRTGYFFAFLFEVVNEIYDEGFESAITEIQVI